ncbi:MAG: protein-disulfide reductase DsbD domain-containing protein [Acidobacteriota bacterium]
MRVPHPVVVTLLLLGLAAIARAEGPPAEPFRVRAYLNQDVYHAGDHGRVAVQLKIEHPLHVNGPVAKDDGVIPTSIKWTDVPEGLTLGELSWPKPEKKAFPFTSGRKIPVYERRILAHADLSIAEGLPEGPLKLRGELRAQACDDRRCYRPETVPFKATVRLVPADEPTSSVNESKFEKR